MTGSGRVGAFFTNVQVRVIGDRAAAQDALVRALCDSARARGLIESDEGTPDRTIVLADAGDGWIAVYDEETESQDPATLRAIAALAAQAVGAHAVSFLVHDSDVLEMRLYDAAGEELDRFNSHPDYFAAVSAEERRAAKGHPDRWRPVIAAGRDESALAGAWRSDTLFVEARVGAVADVLGIEGARARTGYRYLAADPSQHDAHRVLRFRLAERPAWESPMEGPPRFESSAFMPASVLFVDTPLHVPATVRNAGGATRGLAVVVAGSALERGLVKIEGGELLVGSPRRDDGTTGHQQLSFVEERSGDGASMLVSRFPDTTIPAAPGGSNEELMQRRPDAYFDRMRASQVHVNVRGRALAEGEGALQVSFVPLEHPDARFDRSTLVEVRRAGWRPLRASSELAPQHIEQLQARDVLFAMVTLDVSTEEAADLATDALERWAPVLRKDRIELTRFPADASKRPKVSKAKKLDPKKIRAAFTSETLVSLRCGPATASDWELATGGDEGLSFGRSLYHALRPSESDPDLPTLALWLSTKDRAVHEIAHARDLARSILDDIFTRGRGTQAVVGRAGRFFSTGLDATLYEQACRIGGQCTLRRSWQTRWLRTMAPGWIWLGPALAARVDVRGLGSTPVGEAHRLEVADVAVTERALADILPDANDWSAAARAMYGPPAAKR